MTNLTNGSKRSKRRGRSRAAAPATVLPAHFQSVQVSDAEIELRGESASAQPNPEREKPEQAPLVRQALEAAQVACTAAREASDAAWQQTRAAQRSLNYARAALSVSLTTAVVVVGLLLLK